MTDASIFLMPPFDDADLVARVCDVPPGGQDGPGSGLASDRSGLLVTIPVAPTPARERLLFWLAVHDAQPRPGTARAIGDSDPVQVCGPPRSPLAGRVFDGPLDATWRAIWHAAVPEIISAMGRQDSDTVRARLPMIWSRAASRARGQGTARRSLSGLDARHVRMHAVDRPYAKFFTVEDMTYGHDRFDGTDSGPLERAVFVGADAVTVLPWDPIRDRVLVIEQMRAAPLARSDPQPWLVEPVAGRIDPGEAPEDAARRETAEEAGVAVAALHKVGEYYPTTGAFSEYLFSYVGIADLPDDAAGLGGLASEAEDIRGHVMPRARLMDLIAEGQAPVGPLHLTAFWLALHADRLRGRG
jgi:nudix-type nucleoside diphosphatase (YffH/AdpP family)